MVLSHLTHVSSAMYSFSQMIGGRQLQRSGRAMKPGSHGVQVAAPSAEKVASGHPTQLIPKVQRSRECRTCRT